MCCFFLILLSPLASMDGVGEKWSVAFIFFLFLLKRHIHYIRCLFQIVKVESILKYYIYIYIFNTKHFPLASCYNSFYVTFFHCYSFVPLFFCCCFGLNLFIQKGIHKTKRSFILQYYDQ